MPNIGLLGGTFDPIHFGHLRMAQELAEALNLDEVRFIPAANPPHKATPSISSAHRAAMVQLAITDNTIFKLDNRELLRTGASYTIDTLINLRNELGENTSLVLFMGSDAFTNFHTWHEWEKIIQLCHIALVQRSVGTMKAPLAKVLETFLHNHYTENIDDLRETNAGYVTMQSITPLDISSTAIRTNLQNKNSARYLMPDGVLDYIKSNMLYNNSAK